MGESFATGASQVGIVYINVDDEENSVKRLTAERRHVQLVTGCILDCFFVEPA